MDLVEQRLLALLFFNMDVNQILNIHINMIMLQIDFLHAVLELSTIFILELFEAILCMQLLNLILLANILIQILIKLKVAGNEIWLITSLITNDLPNNFGAIKLVFVGYLMELFYEN